MPPLTNETIEQCRALWEAAVSTDDHEARKTLLAPLADNLGDLTEPEWDRIAAELPGFTTWWDRIRGTYLDQLDILLAQEDCTRKPR